MSTAAKPKKEPMLLTWRDKIYTYKNTFIKYHEDTRQDINMPICGADTESTRRLGTGIKELDEPKIGPPLPPVYESQCVTFATPSRKGIRWIKPGECALIVLIDALLLDAEPGIDHKKTLFVYIHNLGYDVGQLLKWRPDLMAFGRAGTYQHGKIKSKPIRPGRSKNEYYIKRIRAHHVYLKNNALFVGTAPHFTVRCYRSRTDYMDITFLDSGSFFRGKLSKIAEQLKLPVMKQEQQADLGKKDYRLIPDSDPLKKAFVDYAIDDAEVVRLVGEKIADLHREAEFTKIRASAPGFAHSYFTKQLGKLNTVIFSGSLNQKDMSLIMQTYAGGRTGGLHHGLVRNLYVYDFASSYTAAMLSLPSFGPKMKYRRLKPGELSWPNVWQWIKDIPFCFLRVDGEETDAKYPALITEQGGKLTPVYGKFEGVATTGIEIYCGVMSGSLLITQVHEAVFCFDTEIVESPFRKFANDAYEKKKKAAKDTTEYILAKLLLNAAYGKWIQSTKAQLIGTDAEGFVCYYPKGQESIFAKMYLEEYALAHEQGRDPLKALEIVMSIAYDVIEEEGLEICRKPMEQLDLSEKEFASSAIPGAASLVTAIARTRLRALIKCTGAIYWDTDSGFIQHMPPDKIGPCLEKGTAWLHPALVPLRLGKELGELDLEIENAEGYLAGTKRYYLTGSKDDVSKIKSAIHGITNMYSPNVKDRIKCRYSEAVIRALATGKEIRYRTKGSPLKAKGTPDALVGMFVNTSVAPKFNLDTRLSWNWDVSKSVFVGSVKTWQDQLAQ